ncbi:MAG: glycine cleavage system protein GcvH [Francisella sp.]|jgi:glycine cleavage system H protein|nr:MAG: glycine cleavage system protein GcvH [Francisella sp.]
MSQIINELLYSESHEWVRKENDTTVTVGITDYAQELLGDVVFVELPQVGHTLSKGQEAGVVESVKAASDIYAPISGKVLETNSELASEPSLVNTDPYTRGWLFKLELTQPEELEMLLSAIDYEKLAV